MRAPSLKLVTRLTVLSVASISLSGCLDHPLKPVELEKNQELKNQIQLTVNKDVDILFVIDNSGSMGEEQGTLAANFPAFIDVLEDPEVKANYRIGITTTDNSNPWCGAATTPEAGALVLSSCVNRQGQFTNQQGTLDVYDLACASNCTLDDAALPITATTTDRDPDPKPRPWLENIENTKNIPQAIDMGDAFSCFGPQGIDGCGFESQLESMFKSVVRFNTDGDPAFGFLRDSAILAIIQVTDEADCSYNNDWQTIFEQDGNKVFWDDAADTFPTSAVCWNAGTNCTPNGAFYDCISGDYDVDGNLIAPDDPNLAEKAVLHPTDRYKDQIQGIETAKKELNPDQEVIVALIGGVDGMGTPQYADIADPTFMKDFGIGPGCSEQVDSIACATDDDCTVVEGTCTGGVCGTTQTAVPPVRLADFTDNFTTDNMFSVCSDDYSPALLSVADQIRSQIRPACYGECVKDDDPSTPDFVEPNCQVVEVDGTVETEISECAKGADGAYTVDTQTNDYAMPDANTHVCYAILTDDTGGKSPDPLDNMSEECVDSGLNLEFKIAREPGFPAKGGTSVSATCGLSDFPKVDCPNLAG